MDFQEAKFMLESNIKTLNYILNDYRYRKEKGLGVPSDLGLNLEELSIAMQETSDYLEEGQFRGITNVEDWKDFVMQSLPEGASVKMANDVETALENITSVY